MFATVSREGSPSNNRRNGFARYLENLNLGHTIQAFAEQGYVTSEDLRSLKNMDEKVIQTVLGLLNKKVNAKDLATFYQSIISEK